MPKRRTNDEFINDMKRIHPEYIIQGEYRNCNTVVHVEDTVCGYEWNTKAVNLYYHGCPKCGASIKKTEEEFKLELHNKNDKVDYVGPYVNRKTKVKVKCRECGYIYKTFPSTLLSNLSGCPVCSSKEVIKGVNDIGTTAPHLLPYFCNIEDAYTHTSCSHDEIMAKCPICGYTKKVIIKNLYYESFGCPVCSDGISYPNKFIRSFIKQLPVTNIIFEYSPSWIGRKRFDSYFEFNDKKYIIEMDGDFHYKDGGFYDNDYLKNIANDIYKENLAKEHGIEVIRIDSRKSELLYLKTNILNSILNDIFDLSIINWELCGKEATSNYCKIICDYYQENKFNENWDEIANKFGTSISSVQKYIRDGEKIRMD